MSTNSPDWVTKRLNEVPGEFTYNHPVPARAEAGGLWRVAPLKKSEAAARVTLVPSGKDKLCHP